MLAKEKGDRKEKGKDGRREEGGRKEKKSREGRKEIREEMREGGKRKKNIGYKKE